MFCFVNFQSQKRLQQEFIIFNYIGRNSNLGCSEQTFLIEKAYVSPEVLLSFDWFVLFGIDQCDCKYAGSWQRQSRGLDRL